MKNEIKILHFNSNRDYVNKNFEYSMFSGSHPNSSSQNNKTPKNKIHPLPSPTTPLKLCLSELRETRDYEIPLCYCSFHPNLLSQTSHNPNTLSKMSLAIIGDKNDRKV